MIAFIKGIFYDQFARTVKMLDELSKSSLSSGVDITFLRKTIKMLNDVKGEIQKLIDSGELEVDILVKNNIIRYNTIHERLLTIELFRFLVIINYGAPEEYFKKKIKRIYDEINCFQTPPIITTISNSENYYWALPSYDIIAVPIGEEKNLLNLPDLFHEMGHLIFDQSEIFLKGGIEESLDKFYNAEIDRIDREQRDGNLKLFYQEKRTSWKSSWVMEFCCDLIATYLVGPAYGWTNLKLTTLSSGKNRIFQDSTSHPSDESRMRAIFSMLAKMGHTKELQLLQDNWALFLSATNNTEPANYKFIFPEKLIAELTVYVFLGCQNIDLKMYALQVEKHATPVTKILNDAWDIVLTNPEEYNKWESIKIKELETLL